MTFQSTESFYEVRASTIVRGPYPRSATGLGDNSADSTLATYGHYRLWVDDGGAQPGQYWRRQQGPVLVDEVSVPPRCTRIDIWIENSPDQKRSRIMQDIDAQVPDGTARMLVEDPSLQREIEVMSGGASERKSDCEDEADENLDTFDPTVAPTPADGAGFIEARMSSVIAVGTDPWVGAPDDILSLQVILEIIRGGDSAAGGSARAHMFGPKDGPAGAVMPFTQDATNPNIWRSESQTGRYWQDPEETASMRLLWNDGSLPVAETKLLKGQGDKHSAVIRAPI